MRESVLLCIAGMGGAIGTTISVGLSIKDGTKSLKYGIATESPVIKKLGLDFPALNSIMLTGWDITEESLYSRAVKQEICHHTLIEKAKERLENLKPRIGYIDKAESVGKWVKQESEYIKKLKNENQIEHVIIVNLLPTEP